MQQAATKHKKVDFVAIFRGLELIDACIARYTSNNAFPPPKRYFEVECMVGDVIQNRGCNSLSSNVLYFKVGSVLQNRDVGGHVSR